MSSVQASWPEFKSPAPTKRERESERERKRKTERENVVWACNRAETGGSLKFSGSSV